MGIHEGSNVRRFIVVLAVIVAAVAIGGCSNSDSGSTTTEKTKGSDSVSKGNKTFAVDTPDGQASLSLDGSLPPNWPSDFPAPKDSKVAGSGSVAGSDSGVKVAVYSTRQSGQDAFDSYKSQSALKPTDVKSVQPGGLFLGSMKISGSNDGTITVTEHDGNTYVIVVLSGGGGSASTTTTAKSGSTTSTTAATTTTG